MCVKTLPSSDLQPFSKKNYKICGICRISTILLFLASRFEDFNSPVLKARDVISNRKSWPNDRNDLGLNEEQELVAWLSTFRYSSEAMFSTWK